MKQRVDRGRAAHDSSLVWNAFVDLVATSNYAELTPIQRKAHLVFWYESEVQNGGHGQFFENQGIEHLDETVDALKNLGLECQATVLSRATVALARLGESPSWEDLREAFIEDLDESFHACTPTVIDGLQRHLCNHIAEYIEFY